MNPLRRALVGLGGAGIVLGVLMVVLIATSDHVEEPAAEAILSLVVAWSFLATGLVVWDRQPTNLMGPLMVAFAFAWFLAHLTASNLPGLFAVGLILLSAPYGILAHLLFAFPTGRVERPADRFFVGLAYFVSLVLAALAALFLDPETLNGCVDCPPNPIRLTEDTTWPDLLAALQSLLGIVAIGGLIWHFIRRAREAEPEERLRDAPVWWVAGATMTLFGAGLAGSLGSDDAEVGDLIYYSALAVLATVPVAFWFGVLRWRLSEADVIAERNRALDAELHERLEELRESRARIARASYEERRRMERDLHDGAQQRLVALALDLRLARSTLDRDPAAAAELLEAAAVNLTDATAELRELARGIHPPVLTDRGLGPALEALARRSAVPVDVEVEVPDRAPIASEAAAYFVVSEALTNVARHAHAESARVTVRDTGGGLLVEVRDDGRGGADPAGGSGLRGLAERVEALGGSFEVENGASAGTVLRATIPA